jgi:hypothetical protein
LGALEAAPGALIYRMFVEVGAFHGVSDSSKIEHEVAARVSRIRDQLEALRGVCDEARKMSDNDPRIEYEKRDCAYLAFQSMNHYSTQEITGTSTGPFLSIASLLYEAVTGEQDANMKRACDAVLKFERPNF